ncbi:MAG: hypothetical protein KDK91_09070, partial [Gammaproteobacteria bacterium]|nr:hypothetical protein [Gammaproteobacteria bacterium]
AAIIVWPQSRHFDVLCSAGVSHALAGLRMMVGHLRTARTSERERLKQQCQSFAAAVLSHWPERMYATSYGPADGERDDLLELLLDLDSLPLLKGYMQLVLARDVEQRPGPALLRACDRHGWSVFSADLLRLFEATSKAAIERNAHVLETLSLKPELDQAQRGVACELATRLLSALERVDDESNERASASTAAARCVLLTSLLKAFIAIAESRLLGELVGYIQRAVERHPLRTVQVPVLVALSAWIREPSHAAVEPLLKWLRACLCELQASTEHEPAAPSDWRRASELSCNCDNCKKLSGFLDDPKTQTTRIAAREDVRRHVQAVISGDRCDLSCHTEKRGRPYTLVCTKNDASYRRALATYESDQVDLSKLRTIHSAW